MKLSKLTFHIATILAFSLLAVSPGRATTAIMLTDEDLITNSRLILIGDVLAVRSQRDHHHRDINTYVRLQVVDVLKGQLRASRIILKQLGGQVEDEVSIVFGAPQFKVGQRVLLFLDTDDNGTLRIAHFFQGKYDVVTDAQTSETYVERKIDKDAVKLMGEKKGNVTDRAPLAHFTNKIRTVLNTRAAEVEAHEEKFKDKPIVVTPPEYKASKNASGDDGGVSAEFAFIGNGYRWTEPDSGGVVLYWVNPTGGAPVGGDGVAEVSQGLAAWTDVPTSSIRLHFNSYVFNAYGLRRDGYNLVSYNDPLDQMQDPVNCSGTLALASLVYTTSQVSYANGRAFQRIREADYAFNRNFQCFLGNSTNMAEVACHETGHTIGFDHSNVTTRPPGDDPIMRPFAHGNGRGPRLGFDDVLGVTFVYPTPGNPIDDALYFVGWHYRDFLEREPDIPGWNFWASQIYQCGGDFNCVNAQRINVARAFFYSGEFISMNPRLADANRGTPDYNEAFVQQAYLRYWKRPMDDRSWVDYLNNNRPNNDGHYNTVIQAFITDRQYRARFGYEPLMCDPFEEQNCYSQGGSWDAGSCSCTYINPCWGGGICQ